MKISRERYYRISERLINLEAEARELRRMWGEASPPEAGCPTRAAGSPADQLTSTSEAALSDQAKSRVEGLVCQWAQQAAQLGHNADHSTKAGEHETAWVEEGKAAVYRLCGIALMNALDVAQSAAPKVETCARCAPDGVYYENPGFSPIACDHQPHGETAEASGSDNAKADS